MRLKKYQVEKAIKGMFRAKRVSSGTEACIAAANPSQKNKTKAKAFAQLRHAVHHYAEVKRDVEQGLLDRENKLAERHQGEGEGGQHARAAAAFL